MKTTADKVYVLTNIPTPYRNHFFNCLEDVCSEKNIDTKVYYMAKTEKGRYWNHVEWDIKYKYEFLANYGIRWKGIFFHFNPSIISKLRQEQPDFLIVAGSWNFPTVMLTVLFKFLFPGVKLGFWNEGNFVYETYTKKGIFRRLKQYFYNGFHFMISSGEKSDELVNHYIENPKIVRLVNVVDENKFFISKQDFAAYTPNIPLKLFIASKLNKRKNVFFFLKAIKELLVERKAALRIAGEGEEKKEMEKWVQENQLEDVVQVLGQINGEQVKKELASADVFCMPSKREPFPLSLIEASFMYKPLLVSANIGSLPEMMNDNGEIFIPTNAADILAKTRAFCAMDKEELKRKGQNSKQQADEYFNSMKVTTHFLEDMLELG